MRRVSRLARVWTALLPLIAACHGYRASTTVPVNEQVRIQFPTAREIRGSFADGRPVVLGDIVTVEGQVAKVAGDTIELRLTNVTRASGSWTRSMYEGALATVVLEPRTVVETRGISRGKTALAVGGGAAVLLAIGAIIVVVALASLLAGGGS